MILFELRKQLRRMGEVRLVDKKTLDSSTGFRSIYGFCEDAIKHIRETSGTAGLRDYELYSDVLLVDFDDQPQASIDFEALLKKWKVSYQKYDSGGRSIHYHVPTIPVRGYGIPYSHKIFMKKHAPLSDLSIYKTSGIYRLPGTFHSKHRGKKKVLLHESNYQTKLDIPIITAPSITNGFTEGLSVSNTNSADTHNLECLLMRYLITPVVQGTTGRNNLVFKMAALCKDVGYEKGYCTKLMYNWNQEYCYPPLSRISIDGTVNSAYDR